MRFSDFQSKMNEYYRITKKQFIIFLIVCFILTVAFIIDTILRIQEGDRRNLNTEFKGRVTKIEYDIKQSPTITVNNSSYYIGSGYDTDHKIEVGDSIIKMKGSTIYKLIKHQSGLVVEFNK
jgi:hypothetical protein